MADFLAPHHRLSHTSLSRTVSNGSKKADNSSDTPTPNPSPFIGLRRSRRNRESNAWFMME
jgi:hypothetical protein